MWILKFVRRVLGTAMMGAVPELFYRLPRNAIAIFSGRNLLWHASAIVIDDCDRCFRRRLGLLSVDAGRGVFCAGPPGTPARNVDACPGKFGHFGCGEATRNRRLITIAWALGQAALLAYLITSCYKAITGRRPPPFHGHVGTLALNGPALTDSSHGFQFGFLKGGIFWGWPSGHTTVAFSMALCLIDALSQEQDALSSARCFTRFTLGLAFP